MDTHNHPCFIPPDPDAEPHMLGIVFPDPPGLDDGAIFPPSHFPEDTPASVISNSGLERAPLRDVIQVAVVLIDFEDGVMRDGPTVAQRFRNLFFSTTPGSVSHYYAEASRNKISRFEGDVVGPFRMPHSRSYYANNFYGRSGASPNARDMASDAYDIAIDALGDLQKYDNDGNGFVDAFIVVHAGRGAEQTRNTQDIWSLKWQLPMDRTGHGATVSGFLTVPEDAQLGVCVHELGHLVFGWPDLYDSKPVPTGEGVGSWCLMSSGSWGGSPAGSKPVHPSAWCKASQGWVNIDNVTYDHILDIQEVKISNTVHRLWRQGQDNTDEYYLAENRTKTQYDESLPAQGLLIWHIVESKRNNSGSPYKVALVQADASKNLEQKQNKGDDGDPYPGRSANTSFTPTSNPSSKAYNNQDTFVSIREIPTPSETIRVKVGISPNPFLVNLGKGVQYGIEGFDLVHPAYEMFAFDYDHNRRLNHLAIYRPGEGTFAILSSVVDDPSSDRMFKKVYDQPGQGIGGYDFRNPADRAFAFDYEHSGRRDHIAIYRPGHGVFVILKNVNGAFSKVFDANGIGGYDFKDPADRAFAFDFDHSGKCDHLAVYRPGQGVFVILKNDGGNFRKVYEIFGQGIGGHDFTSSKDRAFAYDYKGSGLLDYIAVYRPGAGIFVVLENNIGVFTKVFQNGSRGIGGYDFGSPADRAFAFDYSGSGAADHIAVYRPGTSSVFVILKNSDGVFTKAFEGWGLGDYIQSPVARAIPFNYAYGFSNMIIYETGRGMFALISEKTNGTFDRGN